MCVIWCVGAEVVISRHDRSFLVWLVVVVAKNGLSLGCWFRMRQSTNEWSSSLLLSDVSDSVDSRVG